MKNKRAASEENRFNSHKLFYFLAFLLFLGLLYPFFKSNAFSGAVLNLILSLILLATVYSIGKKTKLSRALLFAIPAWVANWYNLLALNNSNYWLGVASSVLFIAFYIFSAAVIFSFVIKAERVTAERLAGAVFVYLLVGLVWSSLYGLLYTLAPASFASAAPTQSVRAQFDWTDFLYYSFSTLTTSGFGDIVPATAFARALSILESIFGVFYMAILIARLVSLYTVESQRK